MGGHNSHIYIIPKRIPDTKDIDAHRRIVDAGRTMGYSHTAHGFSLNGVIMATHEGAFWFLNLGRPRDATEKHGAMTPHIVFIVTCVPTKTGDESFNVWDSLLSWSSGIAGELTNFEVRTRHYIATGNEKRLTADIRR